MEVNGVSKSLATAEAETLDEVANAFGLAPFTSFADTREVPEDFDGDPEELEELLGEWTEWYSVADGLAVVRGLGAAISSNESASAKFERPSDVLDELEELEAALAHASETGSTFRFELG